MVVFKILFGILMIFGGCSLLTMPGFFTALPLCWMLSIFMLVGGIVAIIRYIEDKNAENVAKKNGAAYAKTGVGSLIFGIAAVVLAVLARSSETGAEIFIKIVAVLFGLWIVLDGVSFFAAGLNLKKVAVGGWLGMIIIGVLLILAGIFCVVNSFVSLTAIGTVFGISMVMAGVTFMLD